LTGISTTTVAGNLVADRLPSLNTFAFVVDAIAKISQLIRYTIFSYLASWSTTALTGSLIAGRRDWCL